MEIKPPKAEPMSVGEFVLAHGIRGRRRTLSEWERDNRDLLRVVASLLAMFAFGVAAGTCSILIFG